MTLKKYTFALWIIVFGVTVQLEAVKHRHKKARVISSSELAEELLLGCIENNLSLVHDALLLNANPNYSLTVPNQAVAQSVLASKGIILRKYFERLQQLYNLENLLPPAGSEEELRFLQMRGSYITPLSCACAVGCDPKILELLLARGATPYVEIDQMPCYKACLNFVSDPFRVKVVIDELRRLPVVRRKELGIWFAGDDRADLPETKNLLSPLGMIEFIQIIPLDGTQPHLEGRRLAAIQLIESGTLHLSIDNLISWMIAFYPLPAGRAGLLQDVRSLIAANYRCSNVQDSIGQTAFHYVAQFGDLELLQLMLEARGNPLIQDKHGDTALQLAIRRGQVDLCFIFWCFKFTGNMTPDYRFANGKTVFGELTDAGFSAVDHGELLGYLVERGFDLDSPYNTQEPNSPSNRNHLHQKSGARRFSFEGLLPSSSNGVS